MSSPSSFYASSVVPTACLLPTRLNLVFATASHPLLRGIGHPLPAIVPSIRLNMFRRTLDRVDPTHTRSADPNGADQDVPPGAGTSRPWGNSRTLQPYATPVDRQPLLGWPAPDSTFVSPCTAFNHSQQVVTRLQLIDIGNAHPSWTSWWECRLLLLPQYRASRQRVSYAAIGRSHYFVFRPLRTRQC